MFAIREAHEADLPLCAALHAVYTTSTIWQLRSDSDTGWKRGVASHTAAHPGMPTLSFHLQQMNLPRERLLRLPSATIPLADVWERCCIRLVAFDDTQLRGYLCMQLQADQQQGWIDRLLVDPAARQQGAGRALLNAAMSRALAHQLGALMAHVPLRNVPGILFYQRCGFRICGLIEHFYPTREDSLLLSRTL